LTPVAVVRSLRWLLFRGSGGCRSITPVVVRSLQWLLFDHSSGCCSIDSSGGCRSITPVAIVPGSSGSGGCRSITVAVFRSLRWLSFQGLQWLLFQLRGPVAVDPVAAVAVVPVLLIQGFSISFSASVDMDDYQKRSPVENVLGSTGDSHVVVSNRVHGKHSICW